MGMDLTLRSGNSRRQIMLLVVALIFHIIGIIGIGVLHHSGILRMTPVHLLLMGGLLILSFSNQPKNFLIWSVIIALLCFVAEWIGVHYGWLFGAYIYGDVLGTKWQGIPLLIGLNWVLVIAGAASCLEYIKLPSWAAIAGTATFATAYDWLLEPVAVQLQYWYWLPGRIPAYNYICWWGLSALAAGIWTRLKLRGNLFAAGLFVLQVLFFLLLRILL